MEIAVVGVNYQSAPIEIREKFAFTDSKRIEVLDSLMREEISEAVILSTCNRSEIYIVSMDLIEAVAQVKKRFGEKCKLAEWEKYIWVKEGIEAITHLYEVTAGLDSLVLGEDQILGQVRESHELAMTLGTSGKVLNKCFREAITTAKKIKTELGISQYSLSMSAIGVKYIKEKVGSLKGKHILLIGASETNQLAINYLLEEEVEEIYIANRTPRRAEILKEKYPNIKSVPYEAIYNYLKGMDVVVTATASPHVVLKAKEMPKLVKSLCILDMAFPRDVEESIGKQPYISLYNMEALSQIAYENNRKRSELAKVSRIMIAESTTGFYQWAKSIKVDPTLSLLNERCEDIQQETMDYLRRKLSLSCKEDKLIEKMLMSALHRLMREPVAKLKEIQDAKKQEVYLEVLKDLFKL